MPVNSEASAVDRAMAFLWDLHHRVNLIEPKLGGDSVAVRVSAVRGEALGACDDASLEQVIRRRGLRVVYSPDLVTYMRVPEAFVEAVGQRTRIEHLYLSLGTSGKAVATRRFSVIGRALWHTVISCRVETRYLWLLLAIEGLARVLARWRMGRLGPIGAAWKPIPSTKGDILNPSELDIGYPFE